MKYNSGPQRRRIGSRASATLNSQAFSRSKFLLSSLLPSLYFLLCTFALGLGL